MLVTLLVFIALLVVALVTTSVLVFRALQTVAQNADRSHERTMKLIEATQEKFMAADWAAYKSYTVAELSPQGGYEEPSRPPSIRDLLLSEPQGVME